MDLLANRISQSINDLGLQIDSLYKLSEKDRQSFLNKIQHFKTNLMGLKSTLKVTNKGLIQSQYKNIRSEIIEMKRILDGKLEQIKFKNFNQQNRSIQQNRLNSYNKTGNRNESISKHNDSLFDTSLVNRSQNAGKVGVMRHISKKQYEELMNDIVEKSQKNEQLSEELQQVKQQNDSLKQLNASLEEKVKAYEPEIQKSQQRINDVRQKLSIVERMLKERQIQLVQSKESEMQSRNNCNKAFVEISQLKNQLDMATSKILNNSNIEQINLYKIDALQQTISKYQNQLSMANEESHKRELDLHKKIQSLEEYQQLYNQCIKKTNKLQNQLQNQREDIEVLESQLTKSQKQYYELKIQREGIHTTLEKQKQLFSIKIQQKSKEFQILKQMLADSEHFNSIKETEIAELKQKMSQCQEIYLIQRQSRETLQDILAQTQDQFQKEKQSYVCDIELKKIQISKLSEQVRKSLELTKTLQQEINQSHLTRTKVRQDQRILSNQCKDIEIRNIELNKNYLQLQSLYKQTVSELHYKDNQLLSAQKSIVFLQNELKQTKIRLQKAKIQAIQDIRNTLF